MRKLLLVILFIFSGVGVRAQQMERVAGATATGPGSSQLHGAGKIFVDADGNLYVPDNDNNRVQKWGPNAAQGVTVASLPAGGNTPLAVCVDNSGNIYVAGYFDDLTGSVLKYSPNLPNSPVPFISKSLTWGASDLKIYNNCIYVLGEDNKVIKKSLDGSLTEEVLAWQDPDQTYARGMDIDQLGNIYISKTIYEGTFPNMFPKRVKILKFINGSNEYSTIYERYYTENSLCVGDIVDMLVDDDGSLLIDRYDWVERWTVGSSASQKICSRPDSRTINHGIYKHQGYLYMSDFNSVYKVSLSECSISPPSILASSNVVCGESGINIGIVDNCLNYDVKWYNGSTLVGIGNQILVMESGTYSATYTNSCGTSLNSNSIVISDGHPNKPVISPTGSTVICSGTPVVLNASGSGIEWYKDNAYYSSGSSLSTTHAGSYTAKSITSCGSSVFSDPMVVSIGSYPSKPVISPSSSTVVCSGTPVVLNASGSGIEWYKDNAYFYSGSSLSTTQAGSYTAKSVTSCGSSAFSDPVVVSIGSYPTKPVISPSGSTVVCSGAPVVLNASGSGIEWYKDNVYYSSGSSLSTALAGSYTARSVNSCGSSAFSDPLVVTIRSSPLTPVISASGSTVVCSGNPVVLNASGSDIQWFKDNVYFNSGPTLSTAHAGSYTAKSVNSCGSSNASDPIEVTSINPSTPPTISTNGPTTVCFGTPVTLASTGTNIKWYRNGTYFGAGSPFITTKPGIYRAKSITSCGPTPLSAPLVINANLAYKVKKSLFDDTEETTPTATAAEAEAENRALAEEEIQSSCEAHVDKWIEKLAEGLNEEQLIVLRPKLLAICAAGGDLDHPMGASVLDGDKNVNGLKSFADAIKSVEPAAFTMARNPWLVDMPYPYSPKLQATDIFISKSDDKICARIDEVKAALGNPTSDDAFFSALVAKYGEEMSLDREEFGSLLNSCGSCKYLLKEDIKLPVFFDPGAKGCISKSDFDQAKEDLAAAIPELSANISHASYEDIFATFMNHRWGFSLTYSDYKEYEASLSTTPADILCNKPVFTALDENFYADFESEIEIAVGKGRQEYDVYIPAIRNQAMLAYTQNCSAARASLNIKGNENTYHYTLYYYDQVGNLVRTVPPAGVKPFGDDETYRVQRARDFKSSECNYNGPNFSSSPENINTSVADVINNSQNNAGAALEFWAYNPSQSGGQILLSADKQYMVQLCFQEGFVNADIFTLHDDGLNMVSIIRSNHITGIASNLLVWNHIVLQVPAGRDLLSGDLELWLNGKKIDPAAARPKDGCGWEIGSTVSGMPQNTSLLKHIRLYNRYLEVYELRKNAFDACMSAYDKTNILAWHRFNMPVAGGLSTSASNSTNEVQYQPIYPAHTLTTNYAYNTTNQVVKQFSPDAKESNFWYDELGRLVISQNAKQNAEGNFSYTKYDVLGRITEVGQKKHDRSGITGLIYVPDNTYKTFLSQGSDSQLTQTFYDEPVPSSPENGMLSFNQQNLRKRVAASVFRPTPGSAAINGTYYNYDLAGNVKTLWQQLDGLDEAKSIDYEYDLVSGKVNFVAYQHGKNDAFYYQYKYDAENRLIAAYSSIDAIVKASGVGSTLTVPYRKLDAKYQYYLHGPLARVELGDEGSIVQGMDYAYTLQGWLKGVNGNILNSNTEINKDGTSGSYIPKDAMAYSLGYYEGDFQPIGGTIAAAFNIQRQQGGETGHNLYNGNISNSTLGIKGMDPVGYTYRYDQLNRLTRMRQHEMGATAWGTIKEAYKEDIQYDPNGNILKYDRYGQTGAIDKLSYAYYEETNRLAQVSDEIITSTGSDLKSGQSANNYDYDAIGNLRADKQEGINNIDWTVYGKINSISKNAGDILYSYDASGNRIRKISNGTTSWYVRDAQGNNLALYEKKDGATMWQEQHLYGSSRLGIWRAGIDAETTSGSIIWGNSGKKFYELNNHLGNVLAVVSDSRIQHVTGNTVDYYEPDVVSGQDYYPFGMLMPERSFNSWNYRYGYNGKENDNDVKGEGNQQDFGARIYDPRLGRWLSVDPSESKYPNLNPYNFCFDNPNFYNDPDGKDPITGVVEAVTSFALSAGTDFLTNWLTGDDYKTAFNKISWGAAAVDGVTTYALSFVVSGAGSATKFAKLANSKAGKIAIDVVKNMTTNIVSKFDKGEISDISKIDFTNEFLEATVTTLLDKGFGNKADELLDGLKESNGKLYRKLSKLTRDLEAGKGESRIMQNKRQVKIALQNSTKKAIGYVKEATKKELKKKTIVEGGKAVGNKVGTIAN